MNNIDIVFIAIAAILVLLGYLLGFAKVLKLFTSGIFGIVISVIACVMLGGAAQNIGVFSNLITSVNASAEQAASFLKYLYPGYIVFYIVLFVLIQIIRRIIIRIIKSVLESDRALVKIINKTLGVVFMVAFSGALLLLFLAFIKVAETTQFAADFLQKIEGSILMKLYENNPIDFVKIELPQVSNNELAQFIICNL